MLKLPAIVQIMDPAKRNYIVGSCDGVERYQNDGKNTEKSQKGPTILPS